MPQHFSCAVSVDRDAVVLEHRDQVSVDVRFVAIAVAGREQRDLAAGLVGRPDRERGRSARAPARLAEACRCGIREPARRDARRASASSSARAAGERFDRVDDLGDHGDAGNATRPVGRGQHLVAQRGLAARELDGLGAQHQVREIDVPGMRRHVRDTWSCSTCRTGSNGRRPPNRPSWARRPTRRSATHRPHRTASGRNCRG